ncbi:hypothetical protein L596_010695 [Steinernema carpocapsae]|uniref:Uncharacterized protein n=1 Tax=Steinernema carpocapsae TaxID=34508 RepID=A0A4U5PJL7_STECR|nr:hypothetical protein L596_010695 [Steinernema carpocapsae]
MTCAADADVANCRLCLKGYTISPVIHKAALENFAQNHRFSCLFLSDGKSILDAKNTLCRNLKLLPCEHFRALKANIVGQYDLLHFIALLRCGLINPVFVV